MISKNDADVPADLDRAFVIEEFLTWIWWKGETAGGEFALPGAMQPIHIAIEDDLLLRGETEESTQGVLKNGAPASSHEAAAALASGKRLARARLIVAAGEREWSLVLEADGYRFKSLKVPSPDEAAEEAGESGDRDLSTFFAFEELTDAIDALLGLYLGDRLRPEFARTTLPAMRRWVRTRAQNS